MSRIFVSNIPKFVTAEDLQKHFKELGEITESRIVKDANGNSRKFGFVGFKDPNAAILAKKNLNKTYLGASKVIIELAKSRDDEKIQQERHQINQKSQKSKQDEISSAKFRQYKRVVEEGVKKSWDDLVVPQVIEDIEEPAKKTKKQVKSEKRSEKGKKETSEKLKSDNSEIKAIRAPKLSEKNKKYLSKPLTIDDSRIYITNIPYNITEEEVRSAFSKFGNIKKVKVPIEYDGKTKGYAFVTYSLPEQAVRAFSQTDNKVVFGRILHVKPAAEDIGSLIKNAKEEEFEEKIRQKYGDKKQEEKTSFKKLKKKQMRDRLNDTTSWNTLFLNPNTILSRMSDKLGISKSEILLSDGLAPKIALAEAEVIQEAKQWMISVGLNIEFLSVDRDLCERSEKTLLVKNLNYRTEQSDLKELFQFYGIVNKLLLAPNRCIAIVEYQSKQFAANALEKLQNFKFKNSFIFLEYAPVGMLKQQDLALKIDKIKAEIQEVEELSKVVHIKNLNFDTSETSLNEFFAKVETPRSVKIVRDPKKENKSRGFGFAEFDTVQKAVKVIKQLNNQLLDNHRIQLSVSKRSVELQKYDKIKELKEKIKIDQSQKVNNKLIVRNIAFQATKAEIKELFKHFGSIKVVRLPKKMNGQHRGFGFVEFDTAEQAALAKQALSSSHLYGRKLVIEYQKSNKQLQ